MPSSVVEREMLQAGFELASGAVGGLGVWGPERVGRNARRVAGHWSGIRIRVLLAVSPVRDMLHYLCNLQNPKKGRCCRWSLVLVAKFGWLPDPLSKPGPPSWIAQSANLPICKICKICKWAGCVPPPLLPGRPSALLFSQSFCCVCVVPLGVHVLFSWPGLLFFFLFCVLEKLAFWKSRQSLAPPPALPHRHLGALVAEKRAEERAGLLLLYQYALLRGREGGGGDARPGRRGLCLLLLLEYYR